MITKIFELVIGIVLILLGLFFASDGLKTEFIGAGVIFLIVLFFSIIEDILKNVQRAKLYWQILLLRLKNENIRFSMSYLYLIKVDGEYLLVKNSNFNHYQLVGGKYKRLRGTQQLLKDKFAAMDDEKLPDKPLMKHDYALFIPAKNAIKFLNWFKNGHDREISHWREFYEELIQGKAKLLPKKVFPYVNYNQVKTITTPVKRSLGWDCHEILQYDILELLPTNSQLIELRKLKENGDTNYIKWADKELIDNLGYDKRSKEKSYTIGQHTKWAVNQKWSKE